MRAALAYEWVRIRTIRSTWWLTGLAVVLGVGISTLFSWAIHHDFSTSGVSGDELDGLGAALVTQLAASGEIPSVVCFVLAILGIFAWGHEYRHGMIRASLTALNSRPALWFAKYVVVGLWVAAVAFVTMLLSGLVGQSDLGLERSRCARGPVINDHVDLDLRVSGDERFDRRLPDGIDPDCDGLAIGGKDWAGSAERGERQGYAQ